MDGLNDGDLIIREMKKPHDWMWFYALYTKKKFVFCDYEKFKLKYCYPFHDFNKIKDGETLNKIYFLHHGKNIYNKNYDIFLGETKNINLKNKELEILNFTNMKYFDLNKSKIKDINPNDSFKILNLKNENIHSFLTKNLKQTQGKF